MEENGKKGYWLLVVAVIVVVVAGYLALKNRASAPEAGNPPATAGETADNGAGAVCATDVKRCADGSYVSRVPPACEFATCDAPLDTNVPVPDDWEK